MPERQISHLHHCHRRCRHPSLQVDSRIFSCLFILHEQDLLLSHGCPLGLIRPLYNCPSALQSWLGASQAPLRIQREQYVELNRMHENTYQCGCESTIYHRSDLISPWIYLEIEFVAVRPGGPRLLTYYVQASPHVKKSKRWIEGREREG